MNQNQIHLPSAKIWMKISNTSSFCRVFTAKLLEDRTQCTRARWWSPSPCPRRTRSLTFGKVSTSFCCEEHRRIKTIKYVCLGKPTTWRAQFLQESYQLFKVLDLSSKVARREGSEHRIAFVALDGGHEETAAQVRCYRVSMQTRADQLSDRSCRERRLHSQH